jgi:hypothetical protein
MKSSEIKNLISEKYDISKKDIRVQQDHGWIHIYIREGVVKFEDFDKQREFEREIERLVVGSTEVYTFIADDGYDTEHNCIHVNIDDFKYL